MIVEFLVGGAGGFLDVFIPLGIWSSIAIVN